MGSYQDWLAERQQLIERIKELEVENAELRKRLGEDIAPTSGADCHAKAVSSGKSGFVPKFVQGT